MALGTHGVKVKLVGAKRWTFVTPSGGTNHLRIHATRCTPERAQEIVDHIVVENPGVVEAAKVVTF